jgi:hypothetical protein
MAMVTIAANAGLRPDCSRDPWRPSARRWGSRAPPVRASHGRIRLGSALPLFANLANSCGPVEGDPTREER